MIDIIQKIAAVVALGITLATQGWGNALSASMGLSGAPAAAFTAGVSSMATQGGLSLMRNNLDPLATFKDVTAKHALLSTLESMAVGGALSGVTPAQHLSGHFTKAALKSAIHAGFQTVQGHSLNVQDIFKDVLVTSVSGIAASHIGSLYGSGDVDPVTHKALHGVVGGLSGAVLGGSQGALSGASAAIIAETLADLVTPQAEIIRDKIFQSGCDDPLKEYNNYLTTQKDLLLLMTASIMAGFGQDVNVAITASDNALTHNWLQTALLAAELGIEEVENNREEVIEYLKDATDYAEADIVQVVDYLIAGGRLVCKAGDLLPGKAAVKAPAKAVIQGVKSALKVGVKGVINRTAEKNSSDKITWIDENASMGGIAKSYNDSALGARSNAVTQKSQAPSINYMKGHEQKTVRFDGVDGSVMIDRKVAIVTTDKAKNQAMRQSQALNQNGLTGRWEVPNHPQKLRAEKMLSELNIKNIEVKIVDAKKLP